MTGPVLCDKTVQFVLKHDKRKFFRFAPLQSDFATELLARHGRDATDLDTMIVVLTPVNRRSACSTKAAPP